MGGVGRREAEVVREGDGVDWGVEPVKLFAEFYHFSVLSDCAALVLSWRVLESAVNELTSCAAKWKKQKGSFDSFPPPNFE